MRGLTGKIVAITGGCGDLGGATAERLSSEGAKVVLLDILPEPEGRQRASQTAAVAYHRCDQTDRAGIDKVLAGIQREHGRLDAVIANAALAKLYPFQDLPVEYWEQALRLNLTGYFHVAQSAVRLMLAQPRDAKGVRGRVLMTSSWVGQHPLPHGTAYVVTKAGVDALVKALAQEFGAEGIRVNAMAPGLVYSGLTQKICDERPGFKEQLLAMTPVNELGTPEQVAAAYAFLCSDDAEYMTGQVLVVDGGCSVIRRTWD